MPSQGGSTARTVAGHVVVAGVLLWGLRAAIRLGGKGFPIGNGSVNLPGEGILGWWALYAVFGTLAVAALARALFLWSDGRTERLLDLWRRGSDRAWMAGLSLLAFGLSVAVCWGVLRRTSLTIDESAYRFMADLLSHGRLYGHSPPDKLFYDRRFLVNDGKMYAQYFLGWPALLAPFQRLGLPELANPFWFACTVPILFDTVRRLVGSAWARLAGVLYATAPFALFMAATQLSHPSCAFWLALVAWACVRAREPDAPAWVPALLGFAYSAAFFTRPTTALGIGTPFLVAWAWHALRAPAPHRLRSFVAFAVPTGLLATAFLAVNKIQTGHAFLPAYQAAIAYYKTTPYLGNAPTYAKIADFRFTEGWRPFAQPMIALFRLNYATFGWPIGFLFLPFAAGQRGFRLFLASGLCMLGVHEFIADAGIDAFGPVHFFEMLLPLVVLTVLGLRGLVSRSDPSWLPRASVAVLVASMLVALPGYDLWRGQSLDIMGRELRQPLDLVKDLGPSVVFVNKTRWGVMCLAPRVRHFHMRRPTNSPRFDDEVLWLNHISVPLDQAFMAVHYPGRKAYIMDWHTHPCGPYLIPLEGLAPTAYRAALRGTKTADVDHLLKDVPGGSP